MRKITMLFKPKMYVPIVVALVLALLFVLTVFAQPAQNYPYNSTVENDLSMPIVPSYGGPFDYGTNLPTAGNNYQLSNTVYYTLFKVSRPIKVRRLAVRISTGGTAWSQVFGVYSNNPATNRPGILLASTNAVSMTGSGMVISGTVITPTVLPRGWYWSATNGNGTSVPNVIGFLDTAYFYSSYAGDVSSALGVLGTTALTTVAYSETTTSTILPATASTTTVRVTGKGIPIMGYIPD